MRGSDERSGSLFSYVGIEGRLRPDHPLRAIRALRDETLAAMERELAPLYSRIGRPSIATQMLLRVMLLQAFYSVRSQSAGTEARLAFLGHALMENCCSLVVDTCLTQADGHAERLAALAMIEKHADRPRAITLGADKGYDTFDFVNELRSMNVRPHVARRLRGSAIDRRTIRHAGYGTSQRIRKRIGRRSAG